MTRLSPPPKSPSYHPRPIKSPSAQTVSLFVVCLRAYALASSLQLVFFLQAFYLKTYHGTELEERCTACAIKPPDYVCNACDFDIDDTNIPDSTLGSINNMGSTSDDHFRKRSAAVGSSSSSDNSDSRASRSDGSRINIMATPKECEACVVSLHIFVFAERMEGGWRGHAQRCFTNDGWPGSL